MEEAEHKPVLEGQYKLDKKRKETYGVHDKARGPRQAV